MGGKSKSSTASMQTTQTTNQQKIDTTTVGLDHTQGPAVGQAGGNVSIISTDQGAIEASKQVSQSAIDLAGKALDTSTEGLDVGRKVGEKAIDTVGEIANAGLQNANRQLDSSLDFGTALTERAFSFGSNAIDAVTAASKDATATVASTTKQGFSTLAGAIDQAAQASRSDTADTLQKLAKYAAYAIGAIALAGIVYAATRRKG